MKKKIPKNSCRIIKISQDAVYEYLRRNMLDNMEKYFDMHRKDVTKVTMSHCFDKETGEYICIVRNDCDHMKGMKIDAEIMGSKLKDTTDTLYWNNKRYVELTDEEVLAILNGEENEHTK